MDSLSYDYELPGFCPVWSARNSFGCCSSPKRFKKHEIEHVVEKLLRSKELAAERAEIVAQALRKFLIRRVNFADGLTERWGHAAECQHILTFDKDAAAAGMSRWRADIRPLAKANFANYRCTPKNSSTTRISVVFL